MWVWVQEPLVPPSPGGRVPTLDPMSSTAQGRPQSSYAYSPGGRRGASSPSTSGMQRVAAERKWALGLQVGPET